VKLISFHTWKSFNSIWETPNKYKSRRNNKISICLFGNHRLVFTLTIPFRNKRKEV